MKMIERMCEAAVQETYGTPPGEMEIGAHGEQTDMPVWKRFEPGIRAAMKAMMEPTEEMLEAGYHAIWFEGHDEDGRAVEHAETRCWQAMLKTALEE